MHSMEYLEGVELFFEFIRADNKKFGDDDWYCCICVKCRNLVGGKKTLRYIYIHLIYNGTCMTYMIQIHHGELCPKSCVNAQAINMERLEDPFPRVVNIVNDVFGRVRDEDDAQTRL